MTDAILGMVSAGDPAAAWVRALGDTSVKGVVVLLCAGGTTLVARRASAAVRHLTWCLAVGSLLALPVLSLMLPAWRISIPAMARGGAAADETVVIGALDATDANTAIDMVVAASADAGAAAAEGGVVGSPDRADAVAVTQASFGPAGMADPVRLGAVGSAASGRLPSVDWAWIVMGIWLAGMLVVLTSLGVGVLTVRRLGAHARPLRTGRAASLAVRLALRLGVRRPVALLEGDGLAMPMTWGFRRPTVLLPAGADAWPHARLEAVLLHELAHVRRGDYATQILAEIVCAIYWFNPLVWLAARRLRIEREHACDDHVLSAGSKASDYAGQLLDLARSLRARRATAMAAMAMARPSQLTGRLLAVLDEHRSRAALSRGRALPALVAAVALIVPLAAATPSARPEPEMRETSRPGSEANSAPGTASIDAPVAGAAREDTSDRAEPDRDPARPATRAKHSTRPTPPGPARGFVGPVTAAGRTGMPGFLAASQCWDVASEATSIAHNSNDGVETIRWSDGRCRVDVRIEGEVEFTDDFAGIARLSRGALFRIEEDDGETERELEATPGPDGRPVYEWSIDGDRRPFDGEAQAWLREALEQFFRLTGYAADERVEWILASRGPEGVFEEIGLMRSDYVQRRYLQALLEQAELDDAAVQRAVELAGRELGSDYELAEALIAISDRFAFSAPVRQSFIQASQSLGSDYEHRRVLSAALAEGGLSPENVQAILRSAQAIDSDYELAELLIGLIGEYPFDAAMREAYLASAGSIGSDYERRRVLSALVARGELTPENLAAVIEAATVIDSDYELAELLIEVSAHDLSSAALQGAFLEATTSLASDYEHHRVLSRLLERATLTPRLLAVVLVSAARIDSDYELAELLVQVARDYSLAGPLREAFLKAADTIGSEYEHGRVASALLRSRP